jgi:hypothetical protein
LDAGFYSSTNKQVGGQTVGPETRPDREILMAVLSGAMVGPMDGIGLLNASRVLASCRKDGYILKPDRPLSPPDACFTREKPESCYLYTTYSDVTGLGRVRYVFMNTPETLTPAVAMLPDSAEGHYAVYNWYTRTLSPLTSSGKALDAGYEGHAYAAVYPIVDGSVFLGECDKCASHSPRFRDCHLHRQSAAPSFSRPVWPNMASAYCAVQVCPSERASLPLCDDRCRPHQRRGRWPLRRERHRVCGEHI